MTTFLFSCVLTLSDSAEIGYWRNVNRNYYYDFCSEYFLLSLYLIASVCVTSVLLMLTSRHMARNSNANRRWITIVNAGQ